MSHLEEVNLQQHEEEEKRDQSIPTEDNDENKGESLTDEVQQGIIAMNNHF